MFLMAEGPDGRPVTVKCTAEGYIIMTGASGLIRRMSLQITAEMLTEAANSQVFDFANALPDDAQIMGYNVPLATSFSGGGAVSAIVRLGTPSDDDAIIESADVFTAPVDGQAAMVAAGIAPFKRFSAGTTLRATLLSDADVADLDAGDVTIEVLYTVVQS